jgi:hypothetical protein
MADVSIHLPADIFLDLNSGSAINKSALGSTFSVNFTPPLTISPLARNVSLSLIQGTFWWTIPNLVTSTLAIKFLVSGDNKYEETVQVTFPKGLYSYIEINTAINDAVKGAGFEINSVVFRVNGATNRMVLVFEIPAEVTFDNSNVELATLLGFEAGAYRYQPTVPAYEDAVIEGQQIAAFDSVQYLTVATNLVDLGFQLNGGVHTGVIARIGIDAEAGYQILFQPTVPLEISTNRLSEQGVTSATFTLMDQNGNLVDTNGQDWSLLLRIRYYI